MKIYIAIIIDSRLNPVPVPFKSKDKALAYMAETALALNKYKECLEEIEGDEWVYCIKYTYENDYIVMTEHEVVE